MTHVPPASLTHSLGRFTANRCRRLPSPANAPGIPTNVRHVGSVIARLESNTSADPDIERVEEDLRRSLGTKVRLSRTRRGGRIVIEYFGDEELARLYQRLVGGNG